MTRSLTSVKQRENGVTLRSLLWVPSSTPLFPFPLQNVTFSFFFVKNLKVSPNHSHPCALTSYLFCISLSPKKTRAIESQFKCCCYASSEDSKNEYEAIAKDSQISRVKGKMLRLSLMTQHRFQLQAVCIYIPSVKTY